MTEQSGAAHDIDDFGTSEDARTVIAENSAAETEVQFRTEIRCCSDAKSRANQGVSAR
jgi:hypothetical protein